MIADVNSCNSFVIDSSNSLSAATRPRGRRQPRVNDSVEPVGLERLAAIESEWRALETQAYSSAQTYDYARVALSIAEEKRERAFMVTVRDDDALSGVWGLTLKKEPLHKVLRPFSCGTHEEYSWPLLDHPGLAERAFRQAARLAGAADRLMICNVPAQSPIDAAAAALPFPQRVQSVDGVVIPALAFASWAEAERRLSSGMRYNLRSRTKRLAQQGKLSIGWCDSVEESDKAAAFFFKRKGEWLKENRRHSPWVGRSNVPEFFRRLVRTSDSPVVAAVRVDGAPIAVAICLVGSGAVEYALTTFDPQYAAYGPAQLLVRFLAQWAIDRRLDFDFGLTVADYKEQWPTEHRRYISRNVMFTLRGQIPESNEVKQMTRSKLGPVRRRVSGWLLKTQAAREAIVAAAKKARDVDGT